LVPKHCLDGRGYLPSIINLMLSSVSAHDAGMASGLMASARQFFWGGSVLPSLEPDYQHRTGGFFSRLVGCNDCFSSRLVVLHHGELLGESPVST
jgi:hypothetical protein